MKERPTKICEQCGEQYPRRPGRSEQQWEEQRFCSRLCQSTWLGNIQRGQPRPRGAVGVALW